MDEFEAVRLMKEMNRPPRVYFRAGYGEESGLLTEIQRTIDAQPVYTIGKSDPVKVISSDNPTTGTVELRGGEEIKVPLSEIYRKPQLEARMDEVLDE